MQNIIVFCEDANSFPKPYVLAYIEEEPARRVGKRKEGVHQDHQIRVCPEDDQADNYPTGLTYIAFMTRNSIHGHRVEFCSESRQGKGDARMIRDCMQVVIFWPSA